MKLCVYSRKHLDDEAVLLTQTHNFAWLTSGRSFVAISSENGVAAILVDSDQVKLITNNIESQRLLDEELNSLPIDLHKCDWWQLDPISEARKLIDPSKKLILDTDSEYASRFDMLRFTLTPYDVELYRSLGKDCGEIIGVVARATRPGMTEFDVAGHLSHECLKRGIDAIVQLIAADDRIDTTRHPLPTHKRIEDRVMIVLCGRRNGLVLSVTRLVCFNAEAKNKIQPRHDAVTKVDAIAMHALKTGVSGASIFKSIQQAYDDCGYPDEWKHHHQGGCAGYQSREWKATPSSTAQVAGSQAFAWNPSIAGTKSEDTVLFHPDESIEVLSTTLDWPMVMHTIDGKQYSRPDILLLRV